MCIVLLVPNNSLEPTRLRRDEIASGWEAALRAISGAGHGPPRGSAPTVRPRLLGCGFFGRSLARRAQGLILGVVGC
jgi:hypothetical protein